MRPRRARPGAVLTDGIAAVLLAGQVWLAASAAYLLVLLAAGARHTQSCGAAHARRRRYTAGEHATARRARPGT